MASHWKLKIKINSNWHTMNLKENFRINMKQWMLIFVNDLILPIGVFRNY